MIEERLYLYVRSLATKAADEDSNDNKRCMPSRLELNAAVCL